MGGKLIPTHGTKAQRREERRKPERKEEERNRGTGRVGNHASESLIYNNKREEDKSKYKNPHFARFFFGVRPWRRLAGRRGQTRKTKRRFNRGSTPRTRIAKARDSPLAAVSISVDVRQSGNFTAEDAEGAE